MKIYEQLHKRMARIYGESFDKKYLDLLHGELKKVKDSIKPKENGYSHEDVVLITYGDSIKKDGEPPLKTLNAFMEKYLGADFNYVHILPFFPYSSDDGFSVIDYYKVNPKLGEWNHIEDIGKSYNLMFDLVINHISKSSYWFQQYKEGKAPYTGFFIEQDPKTDLSKVVRPRSLPLLTKFDTKNGIKHVWTTFSADQVDLNFKNLDLFLEMMKVYLFYIAKGAKIIRLDAIAFLWKEISTDCLHLQETHEIVKLMHDLAKHIDPSIIILTETNVPNEQNLSYFGNADEADMVYQFSLPPLLLYSLYNGNSKYLVEWAKSIQDIPDGCTFFNFTASHDGIGVRPLEGIVPKEDIENLAEAMKMHGGRVNTKRNSDGTDSPYELNITYLDALKGTREGADEYQIDRFICSQTLMMSFKGMPAFYIHSLIGTHNYYEGVQKTGMNRTINRRKWDLNVLNPLLAEETSHTFIMKELLRRIRIRKAHKAFHPLNGQKVYEAGNEIVALERVGEEKILIVANICSNTKAFDTGTINLNICGSLDLISNTKMKSNQINLEPYQVLWILLG